MKTRVRFGIKGASWLFPNAGIIVFKMDPAKFGQLMTIVQQLKAVIPGEIANKIVCEAS